MYIRVQINGKVLMAMVDTGTTHNVVVDREIQKLGLTLTQHSSRIKTVKNSLRHGDQTYLIALIEIKLDVVQEIPDEVAELLEEFKDVFSPELPKKLSPRIKLAVGHVVEGRVYQTVQGVLLFLYFVPNETRWFDEEMRGLSSIQQDRSVVVYLDDIVIYSKPLNYHLMHLRVVFQKLRKHELYAEKEKCEF
ncbi:UNVERIFIED_CONTAM: hypothetical protein Scaly_1153800 [Sesamum calycinum]|uniref:Reverse transcriptase domain-containing protein n=1 Tax=Sesamum calycinum TaxID=2727403 RepID=A0AAW2Q2N5_9LAMI